MKSKTRLTLQCFIGAERPKTGSFVRFDEVTFFGEATSELVERAEAWYETKEKEMKILMTGWIPARYQVLKV